MKTFNATKNDDGRTVFRYLQKMMPDVPISKFQKLFRKKDIKINGKRTKDKKIIIREGDEIVVYDVYANDLSTKVIKADIRFRVISEDDNILIVNKGSGVIVHDDKNSLDNQVLAYLKYKPTDSFKPSHVGRLDKVTSGLMIYGKTYDAVRQLNESSRQFEKIYEFKSNLNRDITTNYLIWHDEDLRKEICGDRGKATTTHFYILDGRKFARLETGRKHQIRSSLSKLGEPIFGDVRYGGKRDKRVYLHATRLKLNGLKGELEYLNGEEFFSKPDWYKK